ncbi:NAD(P)-dependent oxidoreductase [Bifidobacterium magnum]|uniref:NADH-flavin reductase n=1 Tax=Bifidobacterium magnum TaxID=1692 RepID=A0A087BE71_9BIFI|nr:NAD(P)H-binding protein [Bifidobacterium magnum]KFI69321.1 NADH-flavin reductase [Bifidobacterium magnum]
MKIAVVAANGKAGKLVANELVARGKDVTAIARSANQTDAQHFIQKDIMDLRKADLEGFDAVVDAFGAWTPETLNEHSTTLAHLCDILSGTDTRLLVVGGAGSLFVDSEHTMTLNQTPEFPDAFQPLSAAMAAALADLRNRDDVKWTYISPAADFQADGERTGEYQLGGEELMAGSQGPIISYADYAIAMADEIENGNHIRERISVVRK